MSWNLHTLRERVAGWSPAERAAGATCGLAGLGLLAWAARLWPEWETNPDLSHGFLAVPAVGLLWLRAREGASAGRGLGPGAQLALTAVAGAGLLGAALLATAYAVAMDWSAVPTLFLLSAAIGAGLVLAATLAAGREVAWIRPGWPALVMVAVVLLSSPLPPATYAKLTMGLQEAITVGVVEALRFFGVPALRSGNVINLGTTSVGVEEACSGVRSLVSCVLAGLVLSAILLRSPWRRAVLVGLAGPLALATNFARSLTLTLLARNGVDIAGAWHDGLGYAVLGVTTGLLAALAFALEEKATVSGEPAAGREERATRGGPRSGWRPASAGALACVVSVTVWFGYVAARTEAMPAVAGEVPPLAELVPAKPDAGWEVATRGDLERFAEILQTGHLLERTYSKIGDDGKPTRFTVYVAWWPADGASVSTVAAHTPEACWPGAGWVAQPEGNGRLDLPIGDGRRAGEAEQRTFVNQGRPQRVWYWHLVAGRPMRSFEPRSWREQLRVFFEQGVARKQEQAFVRISCNGYWSVGADVPVVGVVLGGLGRLGGPLGGGGG